MLGHMGNVGLTLQTIVNLFSKVVYDFTFSSAMNKFLLLCILTAKYLIVFKFLH